MSQDRTIALQPGQKERNSISKKKSFKVMLQCLVEGGGACNVVLPKKKQPHYPLPPVMEVAVVTAQDCHWIQNLCIVCGLT